MATNDTKKKTEKKFEGFSDFEREAMKNRAKELLAEARADKDKAAGEKAVQEAIAQMTSSDQTLAKRVHALIKESAPSLSTKTWYGMPAYTDKNGKVVCFFQSGEKYKSRYCTLGFSDTAKLDDGDMWATGFALIKLNPTIESKIVELVKQAIK